MTYSYTQISQYLSCPRRYKHRYLDGWKEKDNRAILLFGRCFEQALGAYFRREDSTAALFTEWTKYQQEQLEYSHGDSWDRMFRQAPQFDLCIEPAQELEISVGQLANQIPGFVEPPAGSKWVGYKLFGG